MYLNILRGFNFIETVDELFDNPSYVSFVKKKSTLYRISIMSETTFAILLEYKNLNIFIDLLIRKIKK